MESVSFPDFMGLLSGGIVSTETLMRIAKLAKRRRQSLGAKQGQVRPEAED